MVLSSPDMEGTVGEQGEVALDGGLAHCWGRVPFREAHGHRHPGSLEPAPPSRPRPSRRWHFGGGGLVLAHTTQRRCSGLAHFCPGPQPPAGLEIPRERMATVGLMPFHHLLVLHVWYWLVPKSLPRRRLVGGALEELEDASTGLMQTSVKPAVAATPAALVERHRYSLALLYPACLPILIRLWELVRHLGHSLCFLLSDLAGLQGGAYAWQ